MMKRALLMTVGTGVGEKEEHMHSLAHGLLEAILHYKPNITIFFMSELSRDTVNSIFKQYKEKLDEEMFDYQCIIIQDVDRFDECYRKIRAEILKRPDWEIIIDYTSGTKTMTMSAAIASVLYKKELNLVSGARGSNGLVLKNTEEIKTQSLYSAYDDLLMDKMREAFNHYRFETAKDILMEIVRDENKGDYLNLVLAYNFWDKFNHEDAMKLIAAAQSSAKDESFKKNKEFLGTLVNAKKVKEYYLLADLINNAQRRFQEGKYDDAVARLYRVVEFIAQTKLKKEYGIETSDVDLKKVPESVKEKYQRKSKNGKITIGLREGYKLLQELEDELGSEFYNDKRLLDLLSNRNNSILAHGFESITGAKVKEVTEFKDKVLYLGSLLYPKLEELMVKAEFMKL